MDSLYGIIKCGSSSLYNGLSQVYCIKPEGSSGLDKDLDQWVFHPLHF